MDVLLINPKTNFLERGQIRAKLALYPPLGILYIAAVLEKKGIDVKIIDVIASNSSLEDIISYIRDDKPRIIGITATSPQIRGAVQLAKAIKEVFANEIVIALGGAHVSADTSFIKRFNCFDFSVEGEGEITFPELVLQVLNGEKIKGNYKGETINYLDEIPFPARHLISRENYLVKNYGRNFATIHTSRGVLSTVFIVVTLLPVEK